MEMSEPADLITATAILTIAILVALVYSLRRRNRERLLLWFALFAGLYGLRILSQMQAVVQAIGGNGSLARFSWSFLNYLVPVPAALAFEEVYGRGWKSSVRALVWLLGAYAVAAILLEIALGRPSVLPDPALGLFFLIPLVLLAGQMSGYQPRSLPEGRVILGGWAVFLLTVVNEHLVSADLVPWTWSAEPAGLLLMMSCLGVAGFRRFMATEQRLASMDEEMKAATRIQTAILPRRVPETRQIRAAVRYAPMASVAGDFYEFVPGSSSSLGILVADVAGHGVPAALVASILKGAISAQASDVSDPAEMIAGLNRTMCRQSLGQLVTAAYLFVDAGLQEARYCSAGHPPSLLLRAAGSRVEELTANGLLLGVRPNETYASIAFGLEPQDRMVLYTDGIIEAASPSGELFGEGRLKHCMLAHRHSSCDQLADSILEEVSKWSAAGRQPVQSDDITVVATDFAGPEAVQVR
jgi:sigma-B regulation protein RsbU (phosphoserine phosphatase)